MLRYFPPQHRRRLAPLLLMAGLFVGGKLAYDEVPRDQPLRFLLPARGVRSVKVTYLSEQDVYAGIEQRYPNGSPRELHHTPSLAPGQYELAIELTDHDGGVRHVARSLHVPSEGDLRIRLEAESD